MSGSDGTQTATSGVTGRRLLRCKRLPTELHEVYRGTQERVHGEFRPIRERGNN